MSTENTETSKKLPLGFKKKWINALRSGEYKQCKDKLRSRNSDGGYSYCVLGVAAHLLGATHLTGGVLNHRALGLEECKIPEAIRSNSNMHNKLFGKNDRGDTFEQLADFIEENL